MFISYPRIEDDLHTDSAVKQCLSVIPELKIVLIYVKMFYFKLQICHWSTNKLFCFC